MNEYHVFLGDKLGHIESVFARSYADAEFVAMGKWPGINIDLIFVKERNVSIDSEKECQR